jgi:hypothetical protein
MPRQICLSAPCVKLRSIFVSNAYLPDGPTQLDMFRKMALLKANDERSRKVITTGRLIMPYYPYRGQEAIPAAMAVIAAVVREKLFGKLKGPVKRIGGPFNPVPFSKPLENEYITDSKEIAAAAIALVKE